MSVRVGRLKYINGKKGQLPEYPGFSPIICLTKHSPYGSLSPYELRDNQGRCVENLWQFSKIYPKVPEVCKTRSRHDKTVIWQHHAEQHYQNGTILPDYWKWRKKGMENDEPVRYPVTYDEEYRASCLGSIWLENRDPTEEFTNSLDTALDYIRARREIYVKLYEKYVVDQSQFKELVNRLENGEKLLIIEVDGPHQESLSFYKNKYGVKDDFIVNDTVEASPENLDILLNDPRHPYGHGYCLAGALLSAIQKINV